MMVPIFVGNMFLIIAGCLIGLADGRRQFLAPAIAILVLYGFVAVLYVLRAFQMSRFFKGAPR
jgi:hypothetical protein